MIIPIDAGDELMEGLTHGEGGRDGDGQVHAEDENEAEEQPRKDFDDQEAPIDDDGLGSGFNIDKGKNKIDFMNGAFQRGKEVTRVKLIASPKLPSQEAIDKHNVCRLSCG